MSVRLLLLVNILVSTTVVYSFSGDGLRIRRESNATGLELTVGKEVLMPEVEEESDEEQEKEANKPPVTDVLPEGGGDEVQDKQKHDKNKGKNIELGMPPKYPLKAESAETSAHDNEIGGCRDHPRAGLVCSKCENGNKCFPAEHESYTYSYCRRSCRHCDPSTSSFHTFWRLRAMNEFEPTWMLQQVEFYADPQEKISLVDDPEKAYASSVYTGYKPSFAFDNNNSTAWYPSGWGIHDNNDDWIAYEFTVAVRVHGIRMVVDKDHATAQPKKVIVEASDKMYGPFMKKWTIYNTDYSVDKVYKLLECDVLWRRLEVDDGAWCFRLIAKLETWEGARRTCEIEGGDLATISNKEEQRFVTDEVGLCSHTWFGLSHTNQGYFWNDGSNSTYRNWKEEMTYSDVQKQTLNCAAMDPEGIWYNFHCSNKFYFLCKKRLVPRPDPRPDLTDNAWPYPPEVPPLIFFSPNVTVPVINSKNLEPGIFPDANGKVEGEEEEDITLSDLFYEQTVEHLKEKGLKPSEEIEADENQEETDFTQELNKIAINTSPGDFQNETKGDTSKNGSSSAHHQEQSLEHIPNKEANNAETSNASADAPKPKPKHKEKPVPPPPEDSESEEDSSYPEIVHGKPVDAGKGGSGNKSKKLPKGQSPKNGTASPYFPSQYQASMPTPDWNANMHESPHKAENIGSHSKKKRKNKQHNAEVTSQDKQSSLFQTNSSYPGMMFYVPNANGTYTLMRPIYPWGYNGYNNGYSMDTGSNAAATMVYPGQTMMYPGQKTPPGAANPPTPKEGDGNDDDEEDQIGEYPETKKNKNKKGEKNEDIASGPEFNPVGPSVARLNISKSTKGSKKKIKILQPLETSAQENKEIPMHPFTGPLGTSLAQQNISKSSRRKIKVLQPLESAAQGEELSIMSEANKIKRKKVLSRTLIHPKHEDIDASGEVSTAKSSKKHHVRGKKHSHAKASASVQPIAYNSVTNAIVTPKTTASLAKKLGKSSQMKVEEAREPQRYTNTTTTSNASPSLGVDNEDSDESGSGSASQMEADNAEIVSDTDEEFWSR